MTVGRQSEDLSDLMSGACYALAVRRASRRLIRLYDAELAPHGLTVSQLGMLAWIKALKRPTVKKIADQMDMDQSAASRGVQPLERDGLVTGAPFPGDKRKWVLALTEAGETKLAEATPSWARAQRRIEADLRDPSGLGPLMAGIDALAQEPPTPTE